MSLIVAVGVVVRVKLCRNSQTAVVVRAENSITVIQVIEIHSALQVCVKIEADHHIFTSLVNSCDVVSEDVIANHRIDICHLVQLTLEFKQTVSFRAWYFYTVNRDCCRRIRATGVLLDD